jgi:hypothetical protein
MDFSDSSSMKSDIFNFGDVTKKVFSALSDAARSIFVNNILNYEQIFIFELVRAKNVFFSLMLLHSIMYYVCKIQHKISWFLQFGFMNSGMHEIF